MANVEAFFGQSQAPFDSRVFDFDMFDHLTMGDAALQDEVIHLFRQQVDSTLLAMAQGIGMRDWIQMAHTLKGAAASVGALRIADKAGDWERTAPQVNAKDQLELLAGQYFAEADRVMQPRLAAMQQQAERIRARA
jgi:HPt (histidine-containing phosphotransfer) domain-containing protein